MKLRKFIAIAFCMVVLFPATACNTFHSENTSNSKKSSSETLSSAQGTTSTGISGLNDDPVESAEITAIRIANVKKYGESIFESATLKSDLGAYKINGDTYLKLDDVCSWFRTKGSYDQANHTITIGDATRASAVFYMPDLSAYPNLDEVIELPPHGLWTNSDITDFKFTTKGVPFQDTMKKIDKRLKAEGFSAATKQQYTELTNSLSEFKQGETKNTYLKYGKGKKESAIQLIDGGLDKNRVPSIIVRMKAESECAKKDSVEVENKPPVGVSDASKQDVTVKSAGITAIRTKATVKHYGLDTKVEVYNINGNPYLNFNDVSMLFHTEITGDQAKHTISIGGDITQANAQYYMPKDLSTFPNPENTIGFPPYEVWTDEGHSGEVIDFKYVTKYGSFQNLMKKIDLKLKSEGFTVATQEQYAQLTMKSHISAFQQGKIENTYIKYKKGFEDFNPYTIQFIEGGLDADKLPIIIVKMLAG